MSGPMMNPITPKAASPPNTPMITSAGCIVVVLLTMYGLRKLSTWLMTAAPSTRRIIALVVSPITNSHPAIGSQMMNAPMSGMMLTTVVASAQKAGLGTPSAK